MCGHAVAPGAASAIERSSGAGTFTCTKCTSAGSVSPASAMARPTAAAGRLDLRHSGRSPPPGTPGEGLCRFERLAHRHTAGPSRRARTRSAATARLRCPPDMTRAIRAPTSRRRAAEGGGRVLSPGPTAASCRVNHSRSRCPRSCRRSRRSRSPPPPAKRRGPLPGRRRRDAARGTRKTRHSGMGERGSEEVAPPFHWGQTHRPPRAHRRQWTDTIGWPAGQAQTDHLRRGPEPSKPRADGQFVDRPPDSEPAHWPDLQ